jgi:hypothetical protein
MFFGGMSNGAALLAVQTCMFTTVSDEDTGHASAIYNSQRQSTVALNIALLTAIATGVSGGPLHAFHAAYLTGAFVAALGSVAAWTLIRTSDARPTIVSARGGEASRNAAASGRHRRLEHERRKPCPELRNSDPISAHSDELSSPQE